jgi:outer membrane lipoprotein SlyB
VHDPRQVLIGTLTPALTWGLFGLIASGWLGLVIWAVVGAICGVLFTYYEVHNVTKAELAHIGAGLPANSSALLTFAETTDASRLLSATASHHPAVASVAAIAGDMSVRVYVGAESPVEVAHGSDTPALPTGQTGLLSRIMLRYPDPDAAKRIAKKAHDAKADGPQIDLLIETDANRHRHVIDPTKYGRAAWTRSALVSWGACGVLVGAISGASDGGILKGGVVTGIVWAIFGVFAGTLYGLWVGRGISTRRLKGIGPLLAAGTSMLLAWADGPVSRHAIDTLTTPESQLLVLSFDPSERGAVLAPA